MAINIMVTLFLSLIILFSIVSTGNSLSYNYYEKTCPDVEFIVAKTVKAATASDKTVPAALLRMHFHDCFIRVILKKTDLNSIMSVNHAFDLVIRHST
jgi:peroxidase